MRLYLADRTELTAINNRFHLRGQGMIEIMKGFHHDQASFFGSPGDGRRFRRIGRQRLFAEYMFAGAQRGDGPRSV